MAHAHIRKDKTCLNCGHEVELRFCPMCGQENVEPKESVWHFVTHFFNDITHFDGKFFSSIKLMFLKPGLLSKEYMLGRRAHYLNPIRMYLFVSFVFFFAFFSLTSKVKVNAKPGMADSVKKDTAGHVSVIHSIARGMAKTDSAVFEQEFEPQTVREYDSFQATLPLALRDDSSDRQFERKLLQFSERMRDPDKEKKTKAAQEFLHAFPQLLFFSLPVFAFFLYLLYFRRRKQYYYVSHGVFTLHVYCTTFLLMLVILIFSKLKVPYINYLFFFLIFVYLLLNMKRFYGQGWIKTIFKFILLNILSLALLIGMFVAAFFITAYSH